MDRATKALNAAGYTVTNSILELVRLGVPQKRRRHVLLGIRTGLVGDDIDLGEVLAAGTQRSRDLRWQSVISRTRPRTRGWTPRRDRAPKTRHACSADRQRRARPPEPAEATVSPGDHSYVSMYGRLKWKEPAQTITSGFGSLGQGRFMHPSLCRTLTPHEAARIQGFPDYFTFDAAVTRTELSVIIGNAVPPALAATLIARLIAADVFGEPDTSRPAPE